VRILHLLVALLHALVAHAHHHAHQIPAVWDRVAQCESGNTWDDTEGIFDGGLQFSPTTWTSFHGDQFAPTADQATKWQQVVVARRVLRVQGVNAWPVCGPIAGLTVAGGLA
jgi:hypothetical protein